jgi:methyltransferase (TIGR00027 family)
MVTVAIEQHFPTHQRIIADDLAYPMLPLAMRTVVRMTRSAAIRDWMIRGSEKSAPGVWGGVLSRKRYIDERLVESAVNLGAGFDTRAYRLSGLRDLPVWEVDQPANVATKRARVRKVCGGVPEHVRLVPIDFDHGDLRAVLARQGYAAAKRTFFICEAVTQYLTESGIGTIFDFLARAASGSRLAFTYIRNDFIDGRATYGQEALYNRYVVKDKLWVFGFDPDGAQGFLERRGWRVVEHPTYEELAERYVKPVGRTLLSTPIESMVYAEKT